MTSNILGPRFPQIFIWDIILKTRVDKTLLVSLDGQAGPNVASKSVPAGVKLVLNTKPSLDILASVSVR